MSAKVVVTGILLVFVIGLLVFIVEFFYPLSAGSEFKTECRAALLKMELEGGMSDTIRDGLLSDLQARNFTSVSVTGTQNAGLGQELVILVDADYLYSGLTGFFTRAAKVQHMRYEKTLICRMVEK